MPGIERLAVKIVEHRNVLARQGAAFQPLAASVLGGRLGSFLLPLLSTGAAQYFYLILNRPNAVALFSTWFG